jgi:tetratricopeptide (TPR) repeat protein
MSKKAESSGARKLFRIALPVLVVALSLGVCLAIRSKMNGDEPVRASVLNQLLQSGEDAERRDDFSAAEECYRNAVSLFPQHARAWAHYGEFQRFYKHDDTAARNSFKKALDAGVPDAESAAYSWRGLGVLAEKSGDTATAIQYYNKSLAAKPLSDTHRSLCDLYGFQRDFAKAAEHARLAAEIDPDDPIALLLYATQLERAGRQSEGIEAFKRAIKLGGCDDQGRHAQPVHCCVLYNSAGYYAVCGKTDGALNMLAAFFETPNHRHLSRQYLLDDPDFVEMKKDQRFIDLVDKYLPTEVSAK